MKIAIPIIRVTCITLLFSAALSASAQVRFAVTAYTDCGGGTSANGRFAVSGTEGQSDAGVATGGGRFSVSGGRAIRPS